MPDLTTQRTLLRKELKHKRTSLTNLQQQQAGLQLAKNLQQNPIIQNAKTIAVYLANDGEINLHSFTNWAWQQGKNICLPILHPIVKKHLLFLKYQTTSELITNKYSIKEPKLVLQNIVPLEQIDVILLPLVGFDKNCNRLGMGGGYYDRTLTQWHNNRHQHTALIGVAHRCQQVAKLPIEPWDIPLDQITTD